MGGWEWEVPGRPKRPAEDAASLHADRAIKCRRPEEVPRGSSLGALRQEIAAYLEAWMMGAARSGPPPCPGSVECGAGDGGVPPGPPLAVAAHAMRQVCRVLGSCWGFRGAPEDTFEPCGQLLPVAVHLLLSYAHFTRSGDHGQYVSLSGAEHLPMVGCVLTALEELLVDLHRVPMTDLVGGPRAEKVVVAVVALHCNSFGWIDSLGGADCEASFRQLCDLQQLLKRFFTGRLLVSAEEESESAPATRRFHCAALGDAVLMDGGVESLSRSCNSTCFTAHFQYGRGIALLVAPPPPPTPPPPSDLAAVGHGHMRGVTRPWAGPEVSTAKNTHVPGGAGHNDDEAQAAPVADGEPAPPRGTLGAPVRWEWSRELGPVSCGERRTMTTCVHAVCLRPQGPLVIHVQFHALSSPPPPPPLLLQTGAADRAQADLELAEWLSALLEAPMPAAIVEWTRPPLDGGVLAVTPPPPRSGVVELLTQYADAAHHRRRPAARTRRREPLEGFQLLEVGHHDSRHRCEVWAGGAVTANPGGHRPAPLPGSHVRCVLSRGLKVLERTCEEAGALPIADRRVCSLVELCL